PGDIAQHPRPECNLVQGHAVATHGGLGLSGADDIIPGILVEVGACLAHEFVKILEFFGTGAELRCCWLDAGGFVHRTLLGISDCSCLKSRPAKAVDAPSKR